MFTLLLAVIYLAFISLGLPDSILGSAWPAMYRELGVGLSSAGVLSAIIAVGTIVSSLLSERLIRRLGTGLVTLVSVGLTAVALFGFSISGAFWLLCLWAVPYGLGAGSVDAALNNFIALHYPARHMSWLHCFWGVGATLGPVIMGGCLSRGLSWNSGYRAIGLIQVALVLVLAFSLPLWRKTAARQQPEAAQEGGSQSNGSLRKTPGVGAVMLAFFCYCSVEATTSLWASSYMVACRGLSQAAAAQYASLFFLGITAGRFLCGFVSEKLGDRTMVRLGQGLIGLGACGLLLPLGEGVLVTGLVLVGLGCAPIYPSLLHATPAHFGRERSQQLMGIQMASAYTGTTLMPPLFGLLAGWVGTQWLPVYLLALAGLMLWMTERLERACGKRG